ncbi:MAG: tRNA lysidine(34) synthetase TilS [Atribacterota bacterium]
MMKVLYKPSEFEYIAVSGGMDSMVLLDFVRNGNHKKTVLHFDHGTKFGKEAKEFVVEYCNSNKIPIITSSINREKDKSESWEEYWRNQRYHFFKSFKGKIALAHHLDDAVETYIFNMLNGKDWSIPPARDNIVRPFLITKKEDIIKWSVNKNVKYMDDPGNDDVSYNRCRIRHEILPECLKVNPGLYKVVRDKIIAFENNFC